MRKIIVSVKLTDVLESKFANFQYSPLKYSEVFQN